MHSYSSFDIELTNFWVIEASTQRVEIVKIGNVIYHDFCMQQSSSTLNIALFRSSSTRDNARACSSKRDQQLTETIDESLKFPRSFVVPHVIGNLIKSTFDYDTKSLNFNLPSRRRISQLHRGTVTAIRSLSRGIR